MSALNLSMTGHQGNPKAKSDAPIFAQSALPGMQSEMGSRSPVNEHTKMLNGSLVQTTLEYFH